MIEMYANLNCKSLFVSFQSIFLVTRPVVSVFFWLLCEKALDMDLWSFPGEQLCFRLDWWSFVSTLECVFVSRVHYALVVVSLSFCLICHSDKTRWKLTGRLKQESALCSNHKPLLWQTDRQSTSAGHVILCQKKENCAWNKRCQPEISQKLSRYLHFYFTRSDFWFPAGVNPKLTTCSGNKAWTKSLIRN